MAAASTLAVDSESEALRASSLTRIALAAPMARAVRGPFAAFLGAIEPNVPSPPPAASASWRAISTPYASESSRMSLPSRTRVFVSGSSFPGAAGSGICLTQTATFMVGGCCWGALCVPTRPVSRVTSAGADKGAVAARGERDEPGRRRSPASDPGRTRFPAPRPAHRRGGGQPDGLHLRRGGGPPHRRRRALLLPAERPRHRRHHHPH